MYTESQRHRALSLAYRLHRQLTDLQDMADIARDFGGYTELSNASEYLTSYILTLSTGGRTPRHMKGQLSLYEALNGDSPGPDCPE